MNKIMTVDELNAIVTDGDMDEFIRVCEARQVKVLSGIADRICANPNTRLVLIAGASSAGKTTTAKRICTQLRVNEREAILISTDDYFVGDKRNPRDENGEFDYEHFDCVDVARLTQDLNALIAGETIHPRRFNFIEHEGYDSPSTLSISPNTVIVIEGIHALNPRLINGLSGTDVFRIFVEPQPKIELYINHRLPSSSTRLLRRLVRDNQFRKLNPAETFKMWPKVLAGEEKWINPYRSLADAEFDSGLTYEPTVLRQYAEGLLELAKLRLADKTLPIILDDFLEMIKPYPPNAVPGDSILRETIGGSQLAY